MHKQHEELTITLPVANQLKNCNEMINYSNTTWSALPIQQTRPWLQYYFFLCRTFENSGASLGFTIIQLCSIKIIEMLLTRRRIFQGCWNRLFMSRISCRALSGSADYYEWCRCWDVKFWLLWRVVVWYLVTSKIHIASTQDAMLVISKNLK